MSKYDLRFEPPWMNAAGFLGFAPDLRSGVDYSRLGAFITNPVSLQPRSPAHGPRFMAYPGGFLLHTGYPNPGLRAVLRRHRDAWQRSPLPVIVHLLPQSPDETAHMAAAVEASGLLAGLEIGLPPEISSQDAQQFARAAEGELPFILRLPMERALELSQALSVSQAAAFSIGPARGALPLPNGGLLHGRLYGPSLFPRLLEVVSEMRTSKIPVLAAGGVASLEQAKQVIAAGATAVQMDFLLWRGQ
jgi:dihydroorotate dehydrogenase (NAD+) catalytic subunit